MSFSGFKVNTPGGTLTSLEDIEKYYASLPREQLEEMSRDVPRATSNKDSHPELEEATAKLQQTDAWKDAVARASKAAEESGKEISMKDYLPKDAMASINEAIAKNPRGYPAPSSEAVRAAEQGIKACLYCGKTKSGSVELKRCSRCKSAFFCDDVCQRNAWVFHKRDCRPPA